MTMQEFKSLLCQAGFKNKKEFAAEFKLAYSSVNNWGSVTPFPPYLETALKWAIKARKYDDLLKDLQKS